MRELGKGKGVLLVFVIIALSAMWMTWAYAAPSITSVTATPSHLKATGSTNSTIRFTLSESSRTLVSILDSSGTAVKTVSDSTLTSGVKSKTWNGKNTAGSLVDEGTYTVSIAATSTTGSDTDTSASIFVDRTDPTISSISASTSTIEDSSTTCVLTFALSEECSVTAAVYSSTNALVKTLASRVGKGEGTNTVSWDLTNTRSAKVADGNYTVKFNGTDASGRAAIQITKSLVIDFNTPTTSGFTSVSKSLFSPNGTRSVSIRYGVSETAKVSVTVCDTSDTVVGTLTDDATQTARSYTVTWKATTSADTTATVDDGTYTIEFNATDTAGNTVTDTETIVIDKTAPTITVGTLTAFTHGGGTLNIPISLSEKAIVTVSIINSNSRTEKALCSRVPMAATGGTLYWDGKKSGYSTAGSYTVKVVAVDPATNSTTSSNNSFTIN